MRLVRLTPKSEECWSHLPTVRASIAEAGVHFKQKGCPTVIDRIVANFAAESLDSYQHVPKEQQHTTAVWYIWDDSAGALRGHLVALDGDWDGTHVTFVYQVWVTPKWPGRRDPIFKALQDTAAVELDHYARSKGAERILMYTLRPSRLWGHRWGFKMRRFMYEHEVTT